MVAVGFVGEGVACEADGEPGMMFVQEDNTRISRIARELYLADFIINLFLWKRTRALTRLAGLQDAEPTRQAQGYTPGVQDAGSGEKCSRR